MWNHAKGKFKVGKKPKSIKKCDRLRCYEFTWWFRPLSLKKAGEKLSCLVLSSFVYFIMLFSFEHTKCIPLFYSSLVLSTTAKASELVS